MKRDIILGRIAPQEAEICPDWIDEFLDQLHNNQLCMHSFLILRHQKIVAEGYWEPFDKDSFHRMYSVSKSFVSAAVGLLCGEGKLSLDSRIIDYFPDKLPRQVHPYIAAMTVRDLLTMATPHTTTTYKPTDKDWAWTFFNTKPDHPAGTVFQYDTSGTYVLNVLVERICQKPFLAYLQEKVLDEIGFSRQAWCIQAPEGYSWGGSGVMATTRDLARFALLFMAGGRHCGRQLLPREYVTAAVSRQIDCDPAFECEPWCYGYGYQVWLMAERIFAFRGMGSQLAICFPEKDLLFVCTGDTQGNPAGDRILYEQFKRCVYDRVGEAVVSGTSAADRLDARLHTLKPPAVHGSTESDILSAIQAKTYVLRDNPMGITRLRLEIEGQEGTLFYSTPRGDKQLRFGMGHYRVDLFPETHYFGTVIGQACGRQYRAMSSAAWTQPNKLVIRCYIIDDYFGNLTITLAYKGDEIGISMHKNAEWFLDEYEGFAGGHCGD